MSLNKIYKRAWQPVFNSDLHSLIHMIDDNFSALFKFQPLVRVKISILILNKIYRVIHFPNIMIHSACSDQQWISSYLINSSFCKIGDLQGVLKSPGGFF